MKLVLWNLEYSSHVFFESLEWSKAFAGNMFFPSTNSNAYSDNYFVVSPVYFFLKQLFPFFLERLNALLVILYFLNVFLISFFSSLIFRSIPMGLILSLFLNASMVRLTQATHIQTLGLFGDYLNRISLAKFPKAHDSMHISTQPLVEQITVL